MLLGGTWLAALGQELLRKCVLRAYKYTGPGLVI